MSELALAARPAFTEARAFPSVDGVRVEERTGLGLATVLVRKGREAALAERVRTLFALDLPTSPKCVGAQPSFVGTGPGTWLAVRQDRSVRFATDLARELEGVASVSDQSSGYTVLRIEGPLARSVLQKGVPIDLHPRAFGPGDAAVTVIAHIGAIFWQVDADIYDVAFFRSMARSFQHWLAAAMAS